MGKRFFENSESLRVLFIMMTAILAGVISMYLGILTALPIFGIDYETLNMVLEGTLDRKDYLGLLKYLQTVQGITLFIVPSLIIAYFSKNKIFSFLKMNNSPGILSILIIFMVIIFGQPIVNFSAEVNSWIPFPREVERWVREMETQYEQTVSLMVSGDTIKDLFINILVIAIIPAIGEEMLFRGIIQQSLQKRINNAHVAIIITSILFSAFHLMFLTFLPRLLLGLLMGYIFFWSRNLWIPIGAHFINNGLYVVLVFLFSNDPSSVTKKYESMGTSQGMQEAILVSLITVTLLLWIFYRKNKNNKVYNSL